MARRWLNLVPFVAPLFLVACFGHGGTDAQPFDPPMVLNVIPDGVAGVTGFRVHCAVDATGDPTSWSWDFGGGAVVDSPESTSTSADTEPTIILGEPGTHTGTVTVANAGGATPFSFTYIVDPEPEIPTPAAQSAVIPAVNGYTTDLVIQKGDLVFGYWTGPSQAEYIFHLYRSTSTTPAGPEDWDAVTFASIPDHHTDTSVPMAHSRLTVIDERLVLLYTDYFFPRSSLAEITKFRLAVALVDEPAADEDWISYRLTAEGDGLSVLPAFPSVVDLNGHLVVLYGGDVVDEDFTVLETRVVQCAYAETALPESAEDFSFHLLPGEFEGLWDGVAHSMTVHDGKLAACLPYDPGSVVPTSIRLAMAQTSVPTSSGDWIVSTAVDDDPEEVAAPSLVSHQGRLVMAYEFGGRVQVGDSHSSILAIARALVAQPDDLEDWQIHSFAFPQEADGRDPVLRVFDDRLIVFGQGSISGPPPSHFSAATMSVVRAESVTPEQAEHWAVQRWGGIGGSGTPSGCSPVSIDGRVVVLTRDDSPADLILLEPEGLW